MTEISKIEELRESRAKAFEDMKQILERVDADGNMSAEDAQEYDRREADFDRTTDLIERHEKLEGVAPKLEQRVAVSPEEARNVFAEIDAETSGGTGSPEYAKAFEQYVRRGLGYLNVEQRAALQVGTDSEGGYTVADDWVRRLIESEREYGVIQNLATTFRTAESGQVHVPTVATNATAVLTAEEAAFTQSEPTFGEVVFDSYKYGVIMKVSDELLNDSIFDIAEFMAAQAGKAIATVTGTAFATGTGSGQPNGLFTAATTGVNAASATAVTTDELIDLYHSVIDPYRSRASWLMKDATLKAIRKLKDTTNQYLWQPGLQAGAPDLLLGRPVFVDPNAPAMTTGLDSILFGDISAYWVREVGSVDVKRLEELYAANGQVGFRVSQRFDGDLVDTAAVRVLTQA
jgi:HK97 family phage major capsid protein